MYFNRLSFSHFFFFTLVREQKTFSFDYCSLVVNRCTLYLKLKKKIGEKNYLRYYFSTSKLRMQGCKPLSKKLDYSPKIFFVKVSTAYIHIALLVLLKS